jgi:hypothetical protein
MQLLMIGMMEIDHGKYFIMFIRFLRIFFDLVDDECDSGSRPIKASLDESGNKIYLMNR